MAETLPDDPETLKAMLLAERARADRLEQIVKELRRLASGARPKAFPKISLLGLEDVEQTEAEIEAAKEAKSAQARAAGAAKRRTNRGALPEHLPRIEQVIEIDKHACPCCGGGLHLIGEDMAERLDILPAQFRVLVVRRPKYGLPFLRGRCRPGSGAGPFNRGRLANRRHR